MNALDLLAQKALEPVSPTFNAADAEVRVAANGRVGFRVKLSTGKVVTFWAEYKDGSEVVEPIDENGNFRVIAGTRYAEDGGLIPKTASNGGLWSK